MRSPKAAHIGAIDGLRAIAVLAVVAHHGQLLPFRIGARGVELFFVISGFCLSLATFQRAAAGLPFAFDRKRFALDRITRILPTYYVALFLLVLLAKTSFGHPGLPFAPPTRYEWLEDSFLLTNRFTSYNPSFWSLAVEARWYVFFPAILALYVASKRWFAVAVAALYAVSLAFPWITDLGTLPCFMLGIVAADLFVSGRAGSRAFPLLAVVFFGFAAWFDHTESTGDPLWHGAAFFAVLAGVGALSKLVRWPPLAALGTASYSIYLIHQPVVGWFVGLGIARPLGAVFSIVVGIAFWRIVEAPFGALFARLKRRYSATPAPTSPLLASPAPTAE